MHYSKAAQAGQGIKKESIGTRAKLLQLALDCLARVCYYLHREIAGRKARLKRFRMYYNPVFDSCQHFRR
ncbi:MAG: hypothetical protein IJP68_09980 [Selenomonadaceae bacterium]|nr:hypothetical protein [Selenomonadaceae bacterium]